MFRQLTSGKRVWRGQMSEAARGCNYVSWHHFVWHVLLWMSACQPFFFGIPSPLFLCVHLHAHLCEWAICRLCVFGLGASTLLHCPSGFQAHSCKVLGWAHIRCWVGSGGRSAKRSALCRVIAPLSPCCTLPLPPFHTLFFCRASTQLVFGHVPLKGNGFCSEENTDKCEVNKGWMKNMWKHWGNPFWDLVNQRPFTVRYN